MISISNVIFYILIFFAVYIQVFFLVTFLENRKKIIIRNGRIKLRNFPTVTVVVPCWNEERTVEKTVLSLLHLNYPKDKVKIFLVDDGSTDGTFEVIRKFDGTDPSNGDSHKYSNIKVFRKENAGKYTALNLGLRHLETDFFGCLDADSIVDPEALIRIMSYFEKDESVMAVSPSIVVYNPKGFIQKAQVAEYHMSVFIKKMLGFMGAIHVAPGPLTIFKREVFKDLGPYRHAHNTEDMEIAYRMQKNYYKIDQCNDAYVHTNVPGTVTKLFKQRLRWIYGFINNTIDYRNMMFKKMYGDFSVFALPVGVFSILAVGFLFGRIIYDLANFASLKVLQFDTVGFSFATQINNFDPFFINTQSSIFFVLFLYFFIILSIVLGRKMIDGKWRFSLDIIYFLSIFSVVGPFWLLKAIYNTVFKRRMPSWR